MEIKDIKPNTSFDLLELEVVEMEEPREFTNFRGQGMVANGKGKDKTGEIKITLWNDDVDKVKKGDTIVIENGWAKEYRGEIQVSTGKFGKLEVKE